MRGYSVIALDNPRNPINIGSALRACGCFDAKLMVVGGPGRGRMRQPTDTNGQHRHLPLIRVPDVFDAIPFNCVPVAVDLLEGATPLPEYEHPERAFYIFGAENATLGARILDRCRDRIMVPTAYCMNLAATVNVVLYDRMAKGN
jgi:tRNA(Leu) C34 or U34 (ribose-2'-O)-methylase TrmL